MDSESQVQDLVKEVCISLFTNALEKDINLPIVPATALYPEEEQPVLLDPLTIMAG